MHLLQRLEMQFDVVVIPKVGIDKGGELCLELGALSSLSQHDVGDDRRRVPHSRHVRIQEVLRREQEIKAKGRIGRHFDHPAHGEIFIEVDDGQQFPQRIVAAKIFLRHLAR